LEGGKKKALRAVGMPKQRMRWWDRQQLAGVQAAGCILLRQPYVMSSALDGARVGRPAKDLSKSAARTPRHRALHIEIEKLLSNRILFKNCFCDPSTSATNGIKLCSCEHVGVHDYLDFGA